MRPSFRHLLPYSLSGICSTVILFSFFASLYARDVRVGVYDNPPKVSIGKAGEDPHGIFIDLFAYIAKKEKWNIVYVKGTWKECLDRLTSGEIDIMPDVAFSKKRGFIFDFNNIPVLNSWLQMFCRKENIFQSLADLEGKRIAVLEGSIQEGECEELRKKSGILFFIESFPDYESTVRETMEGRTDAIVAGRFFMYSGSYNNNLVAAPVIFSPTSLHFAVKKGCNADLLTAIDKYLSYMVNDPRSVYYQSMERWLHNPPRYFIPGHFMYLLVVLSITAIIAVLFGVMLKHQVNIRTRELRINNEKLRDAMAELKKAHKEAMKRERMYALGRLTSGIAHDFNNLLTPIISCADLMLESPDELKDATAVRRKLEIIKNAAAHGAELVGRMREFYHTSITKKQKVPVRINEIIEDVLKLPIYKRDALIHAENRHIEIVRNLEDDPVIAGNPTEIHEIILNLLINAFDAMPEGGRIDVGTAIKESYVVLKITDTGIGMSEEIRKKCYEPFFTTKGEKGTGMGLAVVKNIVQEYGGSIEIESEEGKGTSIILTFPLEG